ncbi:MAG: hypothetical protein GSR72_03650 [Desulfurococcales archaeon]|nr:hypothetical protein [Desulfurococcales archaeon]
MCIENDLYEIISELRPPISDTIIALTYKQYSIDTIISFISFDENFKLIPRLKMDPEMPVRDY